MAATIRNKRYKICKGLKPSKNPERNSCSLKDTRCSTILCCACVGVKVHDPLDTNIKTKKRTAVQVSNFDISFNKNSDLGVDG